MKAEGLEGVRLQAVRVPRWVRGRERARVVSPVERELPILGLGLSVATPEGGLSAPVVVVRGFEELEALGRGKVEGRIVAFAPDWEGYGRTVRFRSSGASAAAKLGAVAALVRSATGRSIASPHTGALSYEPDALRVSAAAITVEDAEWLRRMVSAGETVTVSLSMEVRLEGEVDSANVIGEIRGSEKPDEVVVMGGHLDSWDVSQGAHDDGCECVAAWQALTILKELGLRPAAHAAGRAVDEQEENGLQGGKAYREALGATSPATWRRSRWTAAASARWASASAWRGPGRPRPGGGPHARPSRRIPGAQGPGHPCVASARSSAPSTPPP
jgi:hypothetical protein